MTAEALGVLTARGRWLISRQFPSNHAQNIETEEMVRWIVDMALSSNCL
jgi:hypothetical protein